jgi:hypothetical protein
MLAAHDQGKPPLNRYGETAGSGSFARVKMVKACSLSAGAKWFSAA